MITMKSNHRRRWARLLASMLVASCSVMFGCQGGGTDGTGIGKTLIRGDVTGTAGDKLPGVMLTILETGDSTETDEQGKFLLETEQVADTITFAMTRSDFAATAVLDVPENAPDITVSIEVDSKLDNADVRLVDLPEFEVFDIDGEIVGACKKYFEGNGDEIRQTRPLRNGTQCLVKVKAFADGEPLGGVKVAVQRRGCDGKSGWFTAATGVTDTRVHLGIAQIPFAFFNTNPECRYRVVAPFRQESKVRDIIPISTLQVEADGPLLPPSDDGIRRRR
jgi:hypothetical protein